MLISVFFHNVKTLFNIVGVPLNQEYTSFEIYAVTVKISMTECHRWTVRLTIYSNTAVYMGEIIKINPVICLLKHLVVRLRCIFSGAERTVTIKTGYKKFHFTQWDKYSYKTDCYMKILKSN